MLGVIRVSVACALLSMTFVARAGPARASFDVAEKRFTVAVPDGFCSEGEGVERYLAGLRSVSSQRLPALVLMKCQNGAFDLFDLFSIRQVDREGVWPSRQAYLAKFGGKSATISGPPSARDQGVAKRLGDVLDAKVAIGGTLQQIGNDNLCLYSVAIFHVTVDNVPTDTVMVGCVTVFAGRVVQIFRYRRGADRATALGMLPELRALANSINPAE